MLSYGLTNNTTAKNQESKQDAKQNQPAKKLSLAEMLYQSATHTTK